MHMHYGVMRLRCFGIGTSVGAGASAGDILGSCAYPSVHKFSGAGSSIGTIVDVFQYLDISLQSILKVYR